MTGFFVAIILLGSFITAIALVLLVVEKSHERDYRLDVTERRDRLVDVMDDADLLVDELNRFADYTVSTCEQKRLEVEVVLRRADALVSQVAAASASLSSVLAGSRSADARVSATPVSEPQTGGITVFCETDAATGTISTQTEGVSRMEPAQPPFSDAMATAPVSRGRVLTLDVRRAEALRLARKGMAHAEIARTLQLGKGEIELITRMGSGS